MCVWCTHVALWAAVLEERVSKPCAPGSVWGLHPGGVSHQATLMNPASPLWWVALAPSPVPAAHRGPSPSETLRVSRALCLETGQILPRSEQLSVLGFLSCDLGTWELCGVCSSVLFRAYCPLLWGTWALRHMAFLLLGAASVLSFALGTWPWGTVTACHFALICVHGKWKSMVLSWSLALCVAPAYPSPCRPTLS